METKDLDIVYLLKPGRLTDEIKYSLRSLKNLPHRRVWLYGNKPSWAANISFVPTTQRGTKWQNTSMMMGLAAQNNEISENFILMNDDFFILKPINKLGYYYDRTLQERADEVRIRSFSVLRYSRYGLQLSLTDNFLRTHGYSHNNYELHIPMIMNRKKLNKALRLYPEGGWAARRSLYGNVNQVGGEQHSDCKIYDLVTKPKRGDTFVSTTNVNFDNGAVGEYLRKKFKEKGDYELS